MPVGSSEGNTDALPEQALGFVGRRTELDHLTGLLDAAVAGRGCLALVAGEPGIGKTHLAGALAEAAAARDVRILWGRCWGGGAPSYWPWVQVVRELIRDEGVDRMVDRAGPSLAPLAAIIPELDAAGDEARSGDTYTGDHARFYLFEAVRDLLTRSSEDRPTLIVLDDLHAADHSSLLLLEFLAPALRDAGVMVVATYRAAAVDGPGVSTLAAVGRHATRVDLSGLSSSEVADLLEHRFGITLGRDSLARLHDITGGHPLFVSEVARLAGSERALDDVVEGRAPVPTGIADTVRARLAGLEEEVVGTLQVASVFGVHFALAPLADVVRHERAEVLDDLDVAVGLGIIEPTAAGPASFRFTHGLVRDALYEEVPTRRRLELHRDVGEALVRVHGDDSDEHIAEIASHFVAAAPIGDVDRAVDFARRAGEVAMTRLAYDEAAGHLGNAVACLDQLGPVEAEDEGDLLLALGDAQMRGSQSLEATETFDRAGDAARRAGDRHRLARAALGATEARWRAPGYLMEAHRHAPLLEEALAAVQDDDSVLHARLAAGLARIFTVAGPSSGAEGFARRSVEVAERSGDVEARKAAATGMRWMCWGPASIDEKLAATERLMDLATETGDRELAWRAHHWRLLDELERGDPLGIRRQVDIERQLAEELREPWFRTHTTVSEAMLALLEGRFDDVDALTAEALELSGDSQVGQEEVGGQLLFLARERGQLAGWEAAVISQEESFPDTFVFRALRIWTLCEVQRDEDARRHIDAFAAQRFRDLPRNALWLSTLALLAESTWYLDDRERAADVFDLLQTFDDRCVVTGGAVVWTGSVDHYLGLAAVAAGKADEAVTRFETAAELHRRIGARPWLGRSLLHLARALERRAAGDDLTRAAEARDEGTALVTEIGLRGAIVERALEPVRPATSAFVFRPAGKEWEVGVPGATTTVRPSKGLRHLHHLVARPGDDVHATELVAATGDAGVVDSGGDAVLDEQARREYKQRIEDLQEEIEEADGFGDGDRAARARAELDVIVDELSAATGLGGRSRHHSAGAERARVNVTRTVKSAIRTLADEVPALAEHLEATVVTGSFCAYRPDPRTVPDWQL